MLSKIFNKRSKPPKGLEVTKNRVKVIDDNVKVYLWDFRITEPCIFIFDLHKHNGGIKVGISQEMNDYNREFAKGDNYSLIDCFTGFVEQNGRRVRQTEPSENWSVVQKEEGYVRLEVDPKGGTYKMYADGHLKGHYSNPDLKSGQFFPMAVFENAINTEVSWELMDEKPVQTTSKPIQQPKKDEKPQKEEKKQQKP